MEQNDFLDAAFKRVMSMPGKPLSGLAACLLKDGRIAWEGFFGTRYFTAKGSDEKDLPVDGETLWRVASMSKPIVALGAMILVEKGLLDLDRDISSYLGYPLCNPNFPDRAITARHLLGHTSSLRDAGFYYPPLGHALRELFVPGFEYYDGGRHFALAAKAPDKSVDYGPGSFYCYCNLGYGVLGCIIEKLSGQRFDLFMKEAVFDPLDIDGAFNPNLLSDKGFLKLSPIYRKGFPDSESWDSAGTWQAQIDNYRGIRPRIPVRTPSGGHDAGLSLENYRLGDNGALFSPQGGMRISLQGMAKIAWLFIDGGYIGTEPKSRLLSKRLLSARLLSEASVSAMMSPGWSRAEDGNNGEAGLSRVYATGIGLMRPTAPGGGPALWGHRGNAYGFLGGMFLDRAQRSGYLYMIGGTGADPDLGANRDPESGLTVWEDELGKALESALRSF
ncbi:MAG: hypothetical protein CVV53_01220 [Spirochaetae bacterium HGW-Spirochaetae-9]|nr:MAG: hypothetical protein CVV53_01220 [Spirochaetae bacterium HGW-Spirochaetae-9]